MIKPITIAVADNHELFLDGLIMMLRQIRDLKVVAEVETGLELLEQVKQQEPDIVLISAEISEIAAITAVRSLREYNPSLGIIALSIIPEEQSITEMLQAGVNGYVIKSANKNEIINAIKTVYSGKSYYCSETTTKLSSVLNKNKFNRRQKLPVLSERELKIIECICREKTNKEIAKELFLSPRTIEALRVHVQEKIQVRSVVGLVIYAIQTGLFIAGS